MEVIVQGDLFNTQRKSNVLNKYLSFCISQFAHNVIVWSHKDK